jgi:hypothetical protein
MTAETELLAKINAAVKAANEAEDTLKAANAEYVSRSKAVGLLLLEAKKVHPTVEEFEAFLKRVDGLSLSRAYDYLRIAGGRTTDEEIREATKERVKKHRAKRKLPRQVPKPPKQILLGSGEVIETDPDSVTVTESTKADTRSVQQTAQIDPTASADAMRAKFAEDAAAADADEELSPEELSAKNLGAFETACRTHLPHLTEADLKKARVFFMEGKWKPRSKRQEAA